MITNFLIVALCVTASTMFGLARYKKQKSKPLFFASCVRLTERLIADISYKQEQLPTLLASFAQSDKSELSKQIELFLQTPYAPFTPTCTTLTAEDKRLLSEFFGSLGKTDAETQILELNGYKKRFEERYAQESEKFKKTGSLTLKLSFLFGLAVGILIL